MLLVKTDLGYEISKDYKISSDVAKYYLLKNRAWDIEKRDYVLYHKLVLEYSEFWWD